MTSNLSKRLLREIEDANYTVLSISPDKKSFMVMCDQGHTYKAYASNFTNGFRCAKCNSKRRRRKIHQDMTKVLELEGYTVLNISDGKGASVTYDLICPNGHSWSSAYSNLYQGHRCSICNNNTSFGEKVIFNALVKDNFTFEYQYRVTDNNGSYHYYDFLVNRDGERPLIIEFDGVQHYEPDLRMKKPIDALIERQNRDAFKTNYAYDFKWDILRIPYSNNNVESIISALSKKLDITFDRSFNYTHNISNRDEIATYYLTHTADETSMIYHKSPETIALYFKQKYGVSKSNYLSTVVKDESRSIAVAKYFLSHSLSDTLAAMAPVGRTTVSLYFKKHYGMSKNKFARKLITDVESLGMEQALTKYDITYDEFVRINELFIPNL